MNAIKISIIKDCDENGVGTIVEEPFALVSDTQLAEILDAFAQRGIYQTVKMSNGQPVIENGRVVMENVSKERNFTVKVREFVEQCWASFKQSAAQQAFQQQLQAAINAEKGTVVVKN